MTPFVTFGALAIIVIMVEATLWFAFRAKAVPISFLHETDTSSLRFFTLTRLRLLAFAHTLFLLGILLLFFFLLW